MQGVAFVVENRLGSAPCMKTAPFVLSIRPEVMNRPTGFRLFADWMTV